MSNTNPIGLFDSGVGGTSIWKEIHLLLPNESTIYLADSANAPYGPKGKEKIIDLSVKNTELLLKKGCKLIVVACNTATTNAIDHLRKRYDVPFIGIEPAIKPAALKSETKSVGILATKGTLSSELFHKTLDLFANGITVIEQEGTGLVELIENGQRESATMHTLLKNYLSPMIEANIDHLVLGCSHYPYLIDQIKDILPNSVKIIDSGEAVAKQTKSILEEHNLLNNDADAPSQKFYTNGTISTLQDLIGAQYNIEHFLF